MELSSQCFDKNGPITDLSNVRDFCTKYTQASKEGCERCNTCRQKWLEIAEKEKEPVIFKCYAGLTNYIIPGFIEGEYVGCVLGGKILTEPADEDHFRKLAREIGANENEYVAAAKELKVMSAETLETIVEALKLIVDSVTSIAYANFKLSELGIDYKTPRKIALEELVFLNCKDVKSPISAREFEVLKLIVLGKNNNEIAKELYISVHTVKVHVSSILEKFSVEDRVQMAVKAVREGLVD